MSMLGGGGGGGRERLEAVVMDTQLVSPHIRRLSLGGPGIRRFVAQAGVDQPTAWVKLFVTTPAGLIGRAYTIRRIDDASGRIDVDFVRHEHGPMSQWADHVRVGDALSLAGPRQGGFALGEGVRRLFLIGDASALPAIESILSSLPASLRVTALIDVPAEQDARGMVSAADVHTQWVVSGESAGPGGLVGIVRSWPVPEELARCQVWLAGEAATVTDLRQHLLGVWRLPRERLYSKAYWRKGQADFRSRDNE